MDLKQLSILNDEKSSLGEGWIFHGRPEQIRRSGGRKVTSFKYPIFNVLVPLHNRSAYQHLVSGFFLSIQGQDYLDGRPGDIFNSFSQFMSDHLGYKVEKAWLQTLPRMFGYAFNPVSFWYCYRAVHLDAVLCEVNNTFGDRHFYFMRVDAEGDQYHFTLPKRFHVSPFFPVSGRYEFEFKIKNNLSDVKIKLVEDDNLKLDTRIFLNLKAMDARGSWGLFWRYGWMTPLVVLRIHWQALKLWLNKVSFYSRPQPPKEKLTL